MTMAIAPRVCLTLLFALLLLGASSQKAHALYGDDFGFAAAQDPEYAYETAFPGEEATWAGTCDLAKREGFGNPADVALAPHCIDIGMINQAAPLHNVWEKDAAPSWRLDPAAAAGSRPDATLAFWFSRSEEALFPSWPDPSGNVRDIEVDLPPGVLGNPEAVAKCPASGAAVVPANCPPASQVGVATDVLRTAFGMAIGTRPIYLMEPREGRPAELLISMAGGLTNVPIVADVRSEEDFGVSTATVRIPTGFPAQAVLVTLWGVPWSSQHDPYRIIEGYVPLFVFPVYAGIPPAGLDPAHRVEYDQAWGPIRPLFVNPTRCRDQVPVTELRVSSWQQHARNPGHWVKASMPADAPVDSCDEVRFDPTMEVDAEPRRSDRPANFEVELAVPQNDQPPGHLALEPDDDTGAPAYWRTAAGRATAHLRDTVVWMPEGVSINPPAGDGLEACSLEQMGYKGNDFPDPAPIRFRKYVNPQKKQAVACPDGAKIGVLSIETPLLEEPVPGVVYMAEQNRNPFGSTYAIYLVAESRERGVVVKLAGKVEPDAVTGRIKATFPDNPQVPFSSFKLRFKTGDHSPLANPAVCGTARTETHLTPWSAPASGPAATPGDDFVVDMGAAGDGCVFGPAQRPFAPTVTAGVSDASALGQGQLSFQALRKDGEQEIAALNVKLPTGVSGVLRGVTYCPEAAIAAADSRSGLLERQSPSCPQSSYIGRTKVGAGAGDSPLYVDGRVYLAGPYKGAPLSMVVTVPAVAGPFDLGTVVVRSALHVDPATAQITVTSDPLPTIREGVPLRVKDIRVFIDRERFMVNPTDCSPKQIVTDLTSTSDAVQTVSSHFQVSGCDKLGFDPRFNMRILDKGRRSTLRSWNPRTRFVVRPRPGDANMGPTVVTLPSSVILDQSNLDTTCTRAQMAAEDCPAGSVVGFAKAWSPLLDEPVQGPVYLAANGGARPLPDVTAVLDGQVRVELEGWIDTVRRGQRGRLRNRFMVVPDVPVQRFQLTMRGGKRNGLLVNSTDLCRSNERGVARFRGANGKVSRQRPPIRLSFKGCKKVRRAAARRTAKRKAARRATTRNATSSRPTNKRRSER